MIQSIKNQLEEKEAQDIFEAYLQKTDYPKKWIVAIVEETGNRGMESGY